jgi:hypothetical protein
MLDKQRRSAVPGFSLTQILDRTFRIYRQNFLPFFVLSAVVQIPLLVINNLISAPQRQALLGMMSSGNGTTLSITEAQAALGQMVGIALVAIVVELVVAYLQGILIYGPIVYVASENHLGRSATLGDGFAAVRNRLQTLAGGLGLFYIILVVVGIPLILPFALCGLGVGILLYVGLALGSLLVPILMLERTATGTGLARSWVLGKSSIWRLLVITLGLNVITFLITLALGVVVLQVFKATTNPIADTLSVILEGLGSFLLLPLLPIALTEVYYSVRTRVEGLDMALKAAPTANPSPADVASPAPPRQLLTNEDYLNVALFAVGAVVLIVLYVIVAASAGPQLIGL